MFMAHGSVVRGLLTQALRDSPEMVAAMVYAPSSPLKKSGFQASVVDGGRV
jgi:hypothetical protein